MSHPPPATRAPRGVRFARDPGAATIRCTAACRLVQATEVVLDAIARSDGTRDWALDELRSTEVEDGLLGDFRLDRHGDITPTQIAIFRVTGSSPPGAGVFDWFRGSVVDRVMTVPKSLSG